MMFFIIAWITFGVAVWANLYLDLRKHPIVRPGLLDLFILILDLFILILIAPLLYIYNLIDRGT